MILAHPLSLLAARAVGLMVRLTRGDEGRGHFSPEVVPFEIFTAENV